MTDNKLRGLVLGKFWDNRRASPVWSLASSEFPDVIEILKSEENLDLCAAWNEILRICKHLKDIGYVDFRLQEPEIDFEGKPQSWSGYGLITPAGIDVIEGTKEPSIAIQVNHSDHSTNYTISNSSQTQIGNGNIQGNGNVVWKNVTLGQIAEAIKSLPDSPEKEEAKNLFAKILENPTVASVLGGLASGLPAAL